MHAVESLGVVRCELFGRFLLPGQLRLSSVKRIAWRTCAILLAETTPGEHKLCQAGVAAQQLYR